MARFPFETKTFAGFTLDVQVQDLRVVKTLNGAAAETTFAEFLDSILTLALAGQVEGLDEMEQIRRSFIFHGRARTPDGAVWEVHESEL